LFFTERNIDDGESYGIIRNTKYLTIKNLIKNIFSDFNEINNEFIKRNKDKSKDDLHITFFYMYPLSDINKTFIYQSIKDMTFTSYKNLLADP